MDKKPVNEKFMRGVEEFIASRKRKQRRVIIDSNPRETRIKAMVRLFNNGKTLEEIGKLYGISRQRVSQIFKKAGYKVRP